MRLSILVACLMAIVLVDGDSTINKIDVMGRVVNLTRVTKLVDVDYSYGLVGGTDKWNQLPDMSINFYLSYSQYVQI